MYGFQSGFIKLLIKIIIVLLLFRGFLKARKEMFYLITHLTHFIYSYMASGI